MQCRFLPGRSALLPVQQDCVQQPGFSLAVPEHKQPVLSMAPAVRIVPALLAGVFRPK